MERLLQRHPDNAGIAHLALPPLYRTASIVADLDDLVGRGWADSVPLLPSGAVYAARIASAGSGDGVLLVAHAYTRYLADLNGGQVLRTRLIRTFGSDFHAIAFTEFPAVADRYAFIAAFHAALTRAADRTESADRIVEEAAHAFELNIRLSEEVVAVADAPA
jgi:heme oxygenase